MTSSLLGEARLQVAPRDLTQYANDAIGPRVTVSGVATWGRNTNFPVILDEVTTQGSYALSWQRGSHFFKAGGDIAHIAAKSSFPVSFAGSFTFASLATFTSGTPSTFAQGFGNPQIDLPDTLYSAFVQDSWTVNNRLTLVYGLRYDYDAQPQDVPAGSVQSARGAAGLRHPPRRQQPVAARRLHLGSVRRRTHAHSRRLRPVLRQGVPARRPQRAPGQAVHLVERRQRHGEVRARCLPGERPVADGPLVCRARASTCPTRRWKSRTSIRSTSASSGSSARTGPRVSVSSATGERPGSCRTIRTSARRPC